MSVGLKNSRIETFRKRYHKDQKLRLMELNPDGKSLSEIGVLEKGFFISRNTDTQEGAVEHLLTVDLIYSDLTEEEFLNSFMCELFKGAKTKRYQFSANTPPTIDEYRFVCGLHPAYNDKKPVT